MQRPVSATGLLVAVVSLVLCTAAGATLVDRGSGLIYDTDRNITWVSDADLFGTMRGADPGLIARIIQDVPTVSNGRTTHTLTTADFSSSPVGTNRGLMTWWGAMAFAQDLVFGGFDDWRLPTSRQPDPGCSQQFHVNADNRDYSAGTGCTGSELGHLFYGELGGTANLDIRLSHDGSYDLFSDVRSDYWTGTPFVVPSAGDASWQFFTYNGSQAYAGTGMGVDGGYSYAWIVRSGDVLATVPSTGIPEPETVSLTLAGLALIGVARRRRRHRMPLRAGRISGALVAGLVASAAEASLVDRGNGMIYDTDRDITWASDVSLLTTLYRADPNLVAEIIAAVPQVSDGRTTHDVTSADFRDAFGSVLGTWWGDMAFARVVRLGGYADWRLPTTLTPDPSCTTINGSPTYGPCHGSELGHLYYDELGGGYLTGIPTNTTNYALFRNLQGTNDYWSGTTYLQPNVPDAAYYMTSGGFQNAFFDLTADSTPWVVRTGDVAVFAQSGVVPEPAVVSLLFAGMGAIGVLGRRRRLRHNARKEMR